MKDIKYIAAFVVIGLILAYATSGPLRKEASTEPRVGTPLGQKAPEDHIHADSAPTDERVYAQGTINVAASLPADVARRTLFLTVKMPAGGPPVAAKRFAAATFPLTFSLTSANNMVGTEFTEGDLILTARLDADGSAGPKQPDDVEVTVPVAASGDRQVSVTLTK